MGIIDRLTPIDFKKKFTLGDWKAEIPKDSETNQDRPVLLFFGGMSMEAHSNAPITESLFHELQAIYGKGPDMAAFASMLSSQATWANRFEDMAQQLRTTLESKRPLHIVVYSLGATEFLKAFLHFLQEREKQRQAAGEKFEPLDLSHVHLIVRSPAGAVKNLADSGRQFLQTVDMMRATVLDKPTAHLEYTLTYPPKINGTPQLDTVLPALYTVFPELRKPTMQGENVEPIPSSNHQTRDFIQDLLNPEQQGRLQELDAQILDTAQQVEQNPSAFLAALEERTAYLKNHAHLDRILKNQNDILGAHTWETNQKTAITALLGFFPLFRRAFFGYGNQEIYAFLQSKGTRIDFVSPDSETFTPLQTVQDFFEPDQTNTVVTMPGSHITFTNRPDDFATAFRQLAEERLADKS